LRLNTERVNKTRVNILFRACIINYKGSYNQNVKRKLHVFIVVRLSDHRREPAICRPKSSRTRRQTGRLRGPHSRSRYLTLSTSAVSILSLQDKRTQDRSSAIARLRIQLWHLQSCLCIKDRYHLSPTNSSVIQRSVVSTAQSIRLIIDDVQKKSCAVDCRLFLSVFRCSLRGVSIRPLDQRGALRKVSWYFYFPLKHYFAESIRETVFQRKQQNHRDLLTP